MKHNWTELAEEAASTAADYHDSGKDAAAAMWHEIAMRRAAIAQAIALASIAESLASIERMLSAGIEGEARLRINGTVMTPNEAF